MYIRARKTATAPPAATSRTQSDAGMAPRLLLAFVKAGGHLVLGTDAGCCRYDHFAGVANHEALIVLARFGFSPLEAIRIATLNGATFLGIGNRTGSIDAGKEADLLIVRGDPSVGIEDIEQVELVFNNGVQYDPQGLLAEVKRLVGWR
jgi:imidazolonepropionase-like amidohydrolase